MLNAEQRRDRARLMALAITPGYAWTCAKCGKEQSPETVFWRSVDPASPPDARLCFICCEPVRQLAVAKLPLRYRVNDAFEISSKVGKSLGTFAVGAVAFAGLIYFAQSDSEMGLLVAAPFAAMMIYFFGMIPGALSEARHSTKPNPAEEAAKRGRQKLNWGIPLPATIYLVASPLA